MKFLIVGAGLAGSVAARLLSDAGHSVIIYESRNHIGGNCYDSNVCGTMVHNYGPHIFHTDDDDVYNFLSRFTEWMPFEFRPVANTVLGEIPLPYHDSGCLNAIGKTLNQEEIEKYIYKDYSEKQWGVDFEKIPKTITNRIPKTKDSKNPNWFEGQKYQCIPKEGYTKMFERMLEGIEIKLNCGPDDWRQERDYDFLIYTGSIDAFYQYRYGRLAYRTLTFEHSTSNNKMPYVNKNECNPFYAYTRKYDHSYWTNNHKGWTVITKEYSSRCKPNDIPFYPMPWGDSQQTYNQYKELADKEKNVLFIGRLATYKYLDMWMVIKQTMLKIKEEKLLHD